jgi:hypothetical protein
MPDFISTVNHRPFVHAKATKKWFLGSALFQQPKHPFYGSDAFFWEKIGVQIGKIAIGRKLTALRQGVEIIKF